MIMKKSLLFKTIVLSVFAMLAYPFISAGNPEKEETFKVLQLNTWCEGQIVKGGPEAIMQIISDTEADVVLLQEVRGQKFIDDTIQYLKEKGMTYYGYSLNISTAFLSRYPIQKVRSSEELGGDSYAFVKAEVQMKGCEFVFYSLHLDWKHLSFYNVRGFDGQSDLRPYARTAFMTDAKQVIAETSLSRRNHEIQAVISDAQKDIAEGKIVILGGDFNEPSYLDWKRNTRNLRDHNGLMVKWPCSIMLSENGYRDCYRVIHPNAVSHPGFTCNAGNPHVPKWELCWALGVDDRERLDRIYYHPDKRISLVDSYIIGPEEDFWDNDIRLEPTDDIIHTPDCVWPSDHKGNVAVFKVK